VRSVPISNAPRSIAVQRHEAPIGMGSIVGSPNLCPLTSARRHPAVASVLPGDYTRQVGADV
jgi:hypothetical protein